MNYRCLLLVLVLGLLWSCKEGNTNESPYLKKGEIALSKPLFQTDNTLINDSAVLAIGAVEEGGLIRYTTNGNDPDESATIYNEPILITAASTIKARAYHSDWSKSEVAEIRFFKSRIKPEYISSISTLNEKYYGQGITTLINNRKGDYNFSSPEWVGVNEEFGAVIDFGEMTAINSMALGFLENMGSWIFLPEKITVFESDNGSDYQQLSKVAIQIASANTTAQIVVKKIQLDTKTRFLKVVIQNVSSIPDWHEGKGTPAWLFMDEWMFN